MPEFDQFIKQFNNIIPAPTSAHPFGFQVVNDNCSNVHHTITNSTNSNDIYMIKNAALPLSNSSNTFNEGNTVSVEDLAFFARLSDNTWRQLIISDAATRESGGGAGNTVNNAKGNNAGSSYHFISSNSNVSNNYSSNIAGGGAATVAAAVSSPTITSNINNYSITNNLGSGIVIGKMTVSTEDRWRLQAQMRRDETRSGNTRREYNKKVTRATMITKGPEGDGFPAGRGKPV